MGLSLAVLAPLIVAPGGAPAVIDGVVTEQTSVWEGGVIVSHSTVEVEAVIAGAAPRRVQVRHVGGAVDGIGQWASGEVWLNVGERVRLSLEPRDGELVVTGGDAGKISLAPVLRYVRTTTASAMPRCENDEVYPLFWGVTTVPYVLDAAGSDDVPRDAALAAIRTSFQTWEAIDCSYLGFHEDTVQANAPVGFVRGGPNVNVVKFIESGWGHDPRAVALTLTTFDCNSGEIFDADITFNGADQSFTTTPDIDRLANDIQNTATHEIGHLAGFDHTLDLESTMYADASPGETKKRDPTADDVQGLCDVYQIGHEPSEPGGCCSSASRPGSPVALAAMVALALARRRRRRGGGAALPASSGRGRRHHRNMDGRQRGRRFRVGILGHAGCNEGIHHEEVADP